ncbi:MAG: type II toxin-antitoxin system PemK/MazF family toxin [Armatimonadetes bacterium]|nr:type II toxin-antitoxin system PemK/MazF family toxin [Armatimonadota bacterium]
MGHEQAGPPRPVLVVSGAVMNRAPYALSLVVPLSSRLKRLPGHLFLPATFSGLRADSMIMCEHLRSISHQRFRSNGPIARVPRELVRRSWSKSGC